MWQLRDSFSYKRTSQFREEILPYEKFLFTKKLDDIRKDFCFLLLLLLFINKNVYLGGWNQDGGVEGRALTPSCESTRITTSCWTIIDRKTLELTKKDTPHPKTKEKPQ